MNKKELQQLARQVVREDPGVRITGTRHYGRGSYALDCVDTRTGYPFVIHRKENWDGRVEAAS